MPMYMIRYDEPLSRHTSFKIGGPACCWIEPENPEGILEAINFIEAKNKKFIIVGKGTNLLVKDEGFNGAIIHLAKGFEKIEIEREVIIKAGAGLNLAKLVKYAFDNGLAGCEFLAGLPGNLCGAIFMNAGVRNLECPAEFIEIKDIILDVEILDLKDREIKTLDKKDIDFKYRSSGLDEKIILGARLKLEKDNKVNIQDRISAFNKKRNWLTKIGFPNAGSIFKNPSPDKSAGMLIESCGLKGERIGGAEISEVHANIIVNLGKATANDVLGLIDLARASVKQKFDIDLELELKII
ncbi:MAG TPA: UDP-N-acetylenolpyruvoylglucosamine reductase [Candidatus Omnitrophica bacterium]|nr:UDP-N-acetylenolpyruvoylglucosamine reductase [Candidatus Omnitrophota bacterium]